MADMNKQPVRKPAPPEKELDEETLKILQSVFGEAFGIDALPVIDGLMEKVKVIQDNGKSKSGKERIVNKTMYLKP